ncbi:YdjY domain-containing protein [Planctomicrobium sp. SH661]|uniref:YdjY domain-containing protein n=1 Tax=Planctomicrobium sp. SH661 TaxID=3448124 RepID=UPI003F5C889E
MLRWTSLLCLLFITPQLFAQPGSPSSSPAAESPTPTPPVPAGAVPLNPEGTILLDKAGGKLLLKTKVCLREGVLEMFICPKQTKEHESVLSLAGKAQIVHAGLLALGAKPGHPAQFQPEYVPPAGDQVEIFVNWIDAENKPHRVPAQDWVRHATFRYFEAPLASVPAGVKLGEGDDALRYDDLNHMLIFFGTMKPELKDKFLAVSADKDYQAAVKSLFSQGQPQKLEAKFIFAGSLFHKRDDGTEAYVAEAGSLVCVANFGDALIDVNIQSTASNDSGLLFEPWTERIPPLGTDVLVEMIPVK